MIKNEIVKAYDEYKENIKRFQDPIQEQDPAVVILITPNALAKLMCERKYDIRIDVKANCYFTSMFGKRTPIVIRWDLPGNVKFVIQGQAEYQRQEKEMLLDKFKRMFEDGGRRMKATNEIKIELKDIKKLQHLYIDIFSEEDEDYPDRRVINNKETTDNTYRPICNRLRELGYEIINNN